MEYTPLSTDFKDDILDSSNADRKYKQIVNNDGTMSLQDETVYQQTGSVYGAKEINEEREAINNIYENKLVTLDEIDLVTEEGFFVDALAVKELNSKTQNILNTNAFVGSFGKTIGITELPQENYSYIWSANTIIDKINTYSKGIFIAAGADGILIGVITDGRIVYGYRSKTEWKLFYKNP